MSATYNWKYKAGVIIKEEKIKWYWGNPKQIPLTADDIKPPGFSYVALFGNDTTGNGSRLYPYRTLSKAIANTDAYNAVTIVASGVYREQLRTPLILLADGDVTLDFTLISTYGIGADGNPTAILGATVRGADFWSAGADYSIDHGGSIFDHTSPGGFKGFGAFRGGRFKWNIVKETYMSFSSLDLRYFENNTFFRTTIYFPSGNTNAQNAVNANIFYQCNLIFETEPVYLDYCLFYECSFKFGTGTTSPLPLVEFPDPSPGFTQINDLNTLQEAIGTAFSVPISGILSHCLVADPLFNNPVIGDFTLASNSPAKNMSYFGAHVGAKSIGYPIRAKSVETMGSFDFSSAINLAVADDSITLTNPTQSGQIDTKVVVNETGREIASLPFYGFSADRNGQYIDSLPDLATIVQSVSDTLAFPASYLVEIEAIVYQNHVYQPGERFTTLSGQLTFTTSGSGVVREIIEAPERHTVLARFSNGGTKVAAGDHLSTGYWYYIESGSVIYGGATYDSGAVFKAKDTSSFSGSGNVVLAMSTESYQHYELGVKPTTNNIGDTRTGSIIRGNGDPAYERGDLGVKEFPINAKFIQIRCMIQVNNLKS